MKYISILLLLALSFGIFGCEPEGKSDAPLAEEFTIDPVVEQPIEQSVVEIAAEPEAEPEIESKPAVVEPAVETVTGGNEKAVEEIAVVIDDETGSEPAVEVADNDVEKPEATKEETSVEKTKTVEVEEATEKPKETTPPAAKEDAKEKPPVKDEKRSGPKLEDTKFFKKCDFVFKNFVDKDGMVNYRRLRRKKRDLLAAVRELGNLPVEMRPLWSKNDEKAFLLNAHNILMIKLIIDNYPIKANRLMSIWFPANSIKQIPGAREKKFFRVAGLSYTLDELEVLLLKTTGDPVKKTMDPRYCFALSNATMMGGKLRNEAYRPDKLDKQIDEQVKKYLLDPKNLTIDSREKKIHLSSMFKLGNFKEAFLKSRYATIKRFREKDPEIKAFLNFIFLNVDTKKAKEMESAGYEVKFRNYDWLLNERPL